MQTLQRGPGHSVNFNKAKILAFSICKTNLLSLNILKVDSNISLAYIYAVISLCNGPLDRLLLFLHPHQEENNLPSLETLNLCGLWD